MPKPNIVARESRITKYKPKLLQQMDGVGRIIDVKKDEFKHLKSDSGQLMDSLNGSILLAEDYDGTGKLRGVNSVEVDDLASLLPDIKKDTDDLMGWGHWLQDFQAQGINILEGVDDPTPDEYELTAEEELVQLNADSMTDTKAKAKLIELQGKWRAEHPQ